MSQHLPPSPCHSQHLLCPLHVPCMQESDEICWICLDENKRGQELRSPCACPRKVHPQCMARWQLQQAGRPEETNCRYCGLHLVMPRLSCGCRLWNLYFRPVTLTPACRFCKKSLLDWKDSLTPEVLKPEVDRVQPIMVVYFEGEIHRQVVGVSVSVLPAAATASAALWQCVTGRRLSQTSS